MKSHLKTYIFGKQGCRAEAGTTSSGFFGQARSKKWQKVGPGPRIGQRSNPDQELAKGRIQTKNWQKVGPGPRIGKRSDPEQELAKVKRRGQNLKVGAAQK